MVNAMGKTIDPSTIPQPKRSLFGISLANKLSSNTDSSTLIKVNVALKNPAIEESDSKPIYGDADPNDGHPIIRINGDLANKEKLELMTRHEIERRKKINSKIKTIRREISGKLINRNKWAKNKGLTEQLEEGRGTLTLTLTKKQINRLATNSDLIDGIELYSEPMDNIVDAMLSTGVDPHALNFSTRRGNGIGIYMSERGCPDAGHISNYTNLGGGPGSTDHSEQGCRYLVKDLGHPCHQIDSPTRQLIGPGRPAYVPLRHTIARSVLATPHSLNGLTACRMSF